MYYKNITFILHFSKTVEYEASNENGKAASKAGKNPWNSIEWGTSMTEIGTEGAVYKSQQMYTDETTYGVTSTLIYGVQWDAIMAYIDPAYKTGTCESTSVVVDSNGKGYYNVVMGEPTTTASDTAYSVKNIYDLSGNLSEYTMEAYMKEIVENEYSGETTMVIQRVAIF